MQQRFDDQLRALGAGGKKIFAAVSGGLDSTVLLDLLTTCPCTVAVAHANFQLRGEESDGDEAWVRQWAQELKIPFYSRRFDTNNYATENGLSIQMAARELRYAWFDELLEKEKYDFLATAHQVNDNLETVLLNLTRGTGLTGLQGIPVKHGKIIRPLLAFNRKEIESYAQERQLRWRVDSSNATDDYNRNFVRHRVVPGLTTLNPSLERTFLRNTERLNAAGELAGLALQQLRITYMSSGGTPVKILKSLLALFHHPAPVLLELISDFGFNLDQCFEIVDAVDGQSGKQFLSVTHQLVIDREHLIIGVRPNDWKEVLIREGQHQAELGPWVLKIENFPKREIQSDSHKALFDQTKLQFPLRWRKWIAGDSFMPLGMDHRKKLSDFLIDQKVSVPDKASVTVLESAGEIAWVVGWRIDNRFKVADETKTIFSATLEAAS